MLSRVVPILLGYAASCAVAGLLVLAVALNELIDTVPAGSMRLTEPKPFIMAVTFLFILIYAALPALLVIIYAERTATRSAAPYAAAGTVIGFAIVAVSGLARELFSAPLMTSLAWGAAFAISGAAAGLTYWAIAGRAAGTMPKR
jgi:hypothetical protein